MLVTGGTFALIQVPELFDPATGVWLPFYPFSHEIQRNHSATLLPSGELLLAGGDYFGHVLAKHEIYNPNPGRWHRRPILEAAGPADIRYGNPFTVQGRQLGGHSEGSSGAYDQSAANFPSLQLRSAEGEAIGWLSLGAFPDFCPASNSGFCAENEPAATLPVTDLPPVFSPGLHLLTAFVGGIASEPVWVKLACSLTITAGTPAAPEQKVAIGSRATFTVRTSGGRIFQWEQCDGDPLAACAPDGPGWTTIPGATSASYTTPPIAGPESGRRFRVQVGSDCTSKVSSPAQLQVEDTQPPAGDVVTPPAANSGCSPSPRWKGAS